jgi:hypothetical protein
MRATTEVFLAPTAEPRRWVCRGRCTNVLTPSAHGIHHLPTGADRLYLGTVISSACSGMTGVAPGR